MEMGRHIGGYLGEDCGDLYHLGMAAAVDLGNLVGVGCYLRGILVEIGVVCIDNIIGQKRQCPGGIIMTPIDRRAFYLGDFLLKLDRVDPLFPADFGQ